MLPTIQLFPAEVLRAIQDHAQATPEVEVCGVITAAGYEPQPNLHETPETHFRMGDDVAERIAAGEVLAVVHSHTAQGFDHPSIEDQEQALAMGIPWGLTVMRGGAAGTPFFWGEGVPHLPLLPRDFRWGPEGTDGKGDCFALVRAWYREHRGIEIPDQPRDRTWEETVPESYVEGYRRAGFRPVPMEDLQPGDGLLMSINSRKWCPNHAGIYLGGEMVLHHLYNRLAERATLSFLRRSITLCLRPPA